MPSPIALLIFMSLALSAAATCPAVTTCLSALAADHPCPLLPVPNPALPPPVAPAGFNLTRIRRGVYSYNDGSYLSLILYSRRRRHLTVVDFPVSQASITPNGTYLLLTAVSTLLSDRPLRHVDMVYSHRHLDHIGNAARFHSFIAASYPHARIRIWGTAETTAFLTRSATQQVPLPTVTVASRPRTITISRRLNLRLQILGGHTQSDLLSFVPPSRGEKGVAHFVDVLAPGSVPFIDFSITIDFGRYIQAQVDLLDFDFEVFSPGHAFLVAKRDIRRNIAYARSVLKAASKAPGLVPPEKFAEIQEKVQDPDAPQFANAGWATLQAVQLTEAECTKLLIRRWGCQLASVDVFGPSHCRVASAFNIVDNQEDGI